MKQPYIIGLLIVIVAVGSFFLGRSREVESDPLSRLQVMKTDHVRGNPDTANVIVFEYSDTECPYCKTFHLKFADQVFRPYGDSIAWVYRHYPLPIYTRSAKEAEALECAAEAEGPDMFWSFLEQIYVRTPSRDGLDPATLPIIAETLGLEANDFNECLTSDRFAAKVREQKLEGAVMGVHQTPSVIIWKKSTDERLLISGANSRFLEVKSLIEEFLRP
jgi:protein-disulfide isomerase